MLELFRILLRSESQALKVNSHLSCLVAIEILTKLLKLGPAKKLLLKL